jgi:hypothetical protein
MRDYGSIPELYAGTAPIASVYLHLRPEPASTGDELSLRWRALRAELRSGGASQEMLTPLDARVKSAAPSNRTLVAFARSSELVFDDELEEFDGPDAAATGLLPLGLPLLRWQQQWVPCVTAVVDRSGADIAVFRGSHLLRERTLVGSDDEIERNAPGGWAQARYQHRAEDSWAHNAAQVAQQVAVSAVGVDAKVVLLAGDVRALQLVKDHLPAQVRHIHHEVTSGLEQVSAGRVELRTSTLHRLIHEAAATARHEAVAECLEAVGRGHAVVGLADTVRALRRGAVDHLLVTYPRLDPRIARATLQPLEVVVEDASNELPALERAPLLEVMVRAAFRQSADVTVLEPGDEDLLDGVAAHVRFT